MVHGVVRAHEGIGSGFRDGCTEGRQIGVLEIAPRYLNIHARARRLRTAVDSKVFWRGHGLQIFRIITLETGHERDADSRSQVRVLAVRFLPASPARIAKDIDVGRPDGQSPIPVRGTITANARVVLGAKLSADGVRDLVDQRRIELAVQSDALSA